MKHTPLQPEAPSSAAEGRIEHDDAPALGRLMVIGALLVMVVSVVEHLTGLITAWDRWLHPALALSLLLHALLLKAAPAHGHWVRLSAVLSFNGYLLATLHFSLQSGGDTPDLYHFLTVMYLLPLAHGMAYLFLPVRWAVGVAAAVFAATFAPVVVQALAGGAPTRWSEMFQALNMVFAAAQVGYMLLMRTVVSMRANFQRTHERMELMQTLAATDILTGLPNRRAMTESLNAALALARRQGQPVVVALFDVDHFKRINDQHGHGAGDQVLVQVAQVLSTQLRASDRLGRWGGEEFLMVAQATPMHAGMDLAERLRRAVAAWQFAHGEALTVSVGVSQFLAGDDADALLLRADKALYRAKELGRNRTELLAVAAAP